MPAARIGLVATTNVFFFYYFKIRFCCLQGRDKSYSALSLSSPTVHLYSLFHVYFCVACLPTSSVAAGFGRRGIPPPASNPDL